MATTMHLTDWLDDLSVRFITNLPREELESVERICFQVEEAQWFYEDFVRPLDPNLPSLTLRQFSMKIFQHCPLFSSYGADAHSKAFAEFLAYKTRVPVRGAILLNETFDQVILVKGWKKGANWSFPRGKINKDEKDIDCAIREVYEETGFDVRGAGLAGDEKDAKFIEVTMREQHMKLFVFAGIPMSTYFEPRTRKEISKIQWYKLSELPTLKKIKQQQQNGLQDASSNNNKFYMVAPFLNPLRKIISSLKKERPAEHIASGSGPQTDSRSDLIAQAGHENLREGPAHDDMLRLMAQLRQSKQISTDTSPPEVPRFDPRNEIRFNTNPSNTMFNSAPGDAHPPPNVQSDEALRESKANAMLSLLRSGGSLKHPAQTDAPPQTPFEQIYAPPSEPPASPKQATSRQKVTLDKGQPPMFPFAHNGNVRKDQRQVEYRAEQQYMAHTSQPISSICLSSSPRTESNLDVESQEIALLPYQRTGDPLSTQTERLAQVAPVVPPASKLPPPKLNTHSSTLLSLFKATKGPMTDPHLSRASSTLHPELSVSSSSAVQTPLIPSTTQATSSTPALATPTSLSLRAIPQNRSTQQETLLNLFRQPKPSPSLIPPDAPVELSAHGSPTHSRMAPIASNVEMFASRSQNSITKMAAPEATTSATVTGPVGEPEFGKISHQHGRTKRASTQPRTNTPRSKSTEAPTKQPSIRILPRPAATEHPSIPETVSNLKKEHFSKVSNSRDNSVDGPESFRPQILKRPSPVVPVSRSNSPQNDPGKLGAVPSALPLATNAVPQKQSSWEDPSAERQPAQSREQKAALLALFGKPQARAISPLHKRSGSIVSPLSEKPNIESELPSPLGFGRSRLGSLQDNGGMGVDGSRTGGASPGDKQFLLGFLNGIVEEGRK